MRNIFKQDLGSMLCFESDILTNINIKENLTNTTVATIHHLVQITW